MTCSLITKVRLLVETCSTLVVLCLLALSFLSSSLVVVVLVLASEVSTVWLNHALWVTVSGGRLRIVPSGLAKHVSEAELADTISVGDLTFSLAHI